MTAKKPTSLKIISGTLQRSRTSPASLALPVLTAAPAPPDWLPNAHAVKEWHRLTAILLANKLLTDGALSALAMLCALHGKIVQLYAAGEAPTASMVSTLQSMMNDFGLTPIAQCKVKPAPDGSKGNRFANNGKRTP